MLTKLFVCGYKLNRLIDENENDLSIIVINNKVVL